MIQDNTDFPGLQAFDALLLDLDGTLLDTRPELVDACAHAFALRDWSFERDTAGGVCGHGGISMVHSLRPAIGDEELALVIEDFLQHYTDNLGHNTGWMPGAEALVDWYAQRAKPVGIVTNKRTDLTTELLARLQITERFDPIVCRDTFAAHKPDPVGLLHCAETWGVAPEKVLWLGDSNTDAEAGRRAGMPTVLLRSLYTPIKELHGRGDWQIDSLEELL